jgi:hypothetical protein
MPQADRDHSWLLWLLVGATAIHMLEEYAFGFRDWLNAVGFACSDVDLHLLNASYLVFGICAAIVAWRAPAFSLAWPALLLLNVVFHGAGTFYSRQLNPGVLTAVFLFLPLGVITLYFARRDGVLTRANLWIAFIAAAFVHAYPVILIVLRPRLAFT